MAVELATAYFSLLPSMRGTATIVNAELAGVQASASAAGSTAGSLLGGGLVKSFGKFIPIIGGLLGGAAVVGGVVDLFTSSIQSASDLNESGNAIKVTFGDASAEIERLASTASTRLGLTQNQFNGIATQFSAFATTIAGKGGDVTGTIDELTTRGADFASVYNIDVADALSLFQSGLAGESEPLRKYGIDVSEAAVKAYAYANGIAASGKPLTEAQKVQARYGAILAQTSKVQGDFANTSDGLANSQRVLAARVEDAKAKLGTALLPTMEKLIGLVLDKGVPIFEKLVDLFIKLEPILTPLTEIWIAQASAMVDVITAWVDFVKVVADGKLSVQGIADYVKNLPAGLRGAVDAFARFIIGIINPVIVGANQIGEAFANAVNSVSALTGIRIQWSKVGLIGVSAGGAGGGKKKFLAAGGVVPSRPGGHDVVVGEGRYNEAVIPLRPDVLHEIGRGIGGGGGSQPIMADGLGLIGWVKTLANGEAQLVWNMGVDRLAVDFAAGGVA